MNIFESVKSEKYLSLNHWRYRLLHWTFSVPKGEMMGARFLYTHYCPLFHLTNLILLAEGVAWMISGVFEFLSTLFAENCPKITIVDDHKGE